MGRLRQLSFWIIALGAVGAIVGFVASGYALGQWSANTAVAQANKEKDDANKERKALIARFPIVRKESYDAGVASSQAKIDSLQKQINDFGDMKKMIEDAHEIVAYTLRFLGKRAEISDARTAALSKQVKVQTAVTVEAKQTLEKVDQKLSEQNAKVDATASATQNIEKKLAPLPASVPAPASKGWFGFGGH